MKQKDTGIKWFNLQYYPQHRKGRSVNMEGKNGVLDRLTKKELVFFTPLGPRYDWIKRGTKVFANHAEVSLLRFLKQNVYSELEVFLSQRNFKWIFLAADRYGVNINNIPQAVVQDYFTEIAKWIKTIFPTPNVCFELWSAYNEKAVPYREEAKRNLDKYIPKYVQSNAQSVAQKMGLGSDHLEYLVERVAEALLIDDLYHPIKISCVARYKDDHVDVNLPRLYLVPSGNHAPWMGEH